MQQFSYHNIIAEVMDDVYMHHHDEKLLNIFGFGEPQITTGDIRQYLQDNPTSLLIQADEDKVDPIRRHLGEVHAEVIDHRRWGAPWHVIEIVRAGLNKAVGISHVAKWMDIPESEYCFR